MPNLVIGRKDRENLFLVNGKESIRLRFLINENVRIFIGRSRIAILENGGDSVELSVFKASVVVTLVRMKGDNAAALSVQAPLTVKVFRDDYEKTES